MLAAVAALAAAACTRTLDPCGKGTYREGNRCVAIRPDASHPPATGDDAAPPPDSAETGAPLPPHDAGPTTDASPSPLDAGLADDATTAVEAGTEPGIDASASDAGADAGADASDSSSDAGEDASCYAQDIARWADFHLSEGFVEALLDCTGFKAACAPASCSVEECLRLQSGVTSCAPCVAAEATCVASSCRQACGVTGSDDSCRACACASGCVELFSSCSATTLDVCADCSATTCVRASVLPPELIMVIVDGLL